MYSSSDKRNLLPKHVSTVALCMCSRVARWPIFHC